MKMKIYFLTLLLFVQLGANAQWIQTNGPYGGDVRAFATDGTNLFAGASGGVFLSTNSGSNWTPVNNGLTNLYIRALCLSGTNLFAGAYYGGVFLSTNNAASWTPVNTGMGANANVQCLAVNGTSIFVGTSSGIYISSNNGASWSAANNGLVNTDVRCLLVNGSTVYAGTNGGGIFKSTDNGLSWTGFNTGLADLYVNTLAFDGNNLYEGEASIHVFDTNSMSWVSDAAGLPNTVVTSLTANGTDLFACVAANGIYFKSGMGGTWAPINTGLISTVVNSVFINGIDIYAGTRDAGIYLSVNNGSSWSAVNTGLTANRINSMAVGTSLFAATEEGAFLTTNGGNSWSLMSNGIAPANTEFYSVAANGSKLFAGSYSDIYYSSNNGNTWSKQNTGITDNYFQAMLTNATTAFVGSNGGVYSSPLTSISWTKISPLSPITNVTAMTLTGNYLFAGTSSGAVYKIDISNTGASWTQVNNGLNPSFINAMISVGNKIYLANGDGVFSSYMGTSWKNIGTGLPGAGVGVAALSGNSTAIFAGSSFGLYATQDTISNWFSVNTGLGNNLVNSLTQNSTTIFVGTFRGGVYKRTIAELVCTLNPPVMIGSSMITICSGIAAIPPLISNVPCTYQWIAADNPNTTGESITLQSGQIISDTIINVSTTPQTVGYTITPTDQSNCVGNNQVLLVNVISQPTLNAVTPQYICSGDTLNIALGASEPSFFEWIAADNTATTGESLTTQNTSSINNTIFNPTTTPQNVVFSIIPTSSTTTCSGNSTAINVTVNPQPHLIAVANTSICSGSNLNIPLSSDIPSSFEWQSAPVANVSGQSITPQLNDSITDVLVSSANAQVLYTVTPISLSQCAGNITTILVNLNPLPVVFFTGLTDTLCNNSLGETLTGTPAGASGVFSGSGVIGNTYSPALAGSGDHAITYTFTDANQCTNSSSQNTFVFPLPATPNICLITVDSISMFNQIIWEKPASNDNIESYYIYRDTANNAYGLVGIVPADSLSFVSDTARSLFSAKGNPNNSSWRYKIAAMDTCGNLSAQSPYHQTIFFQDQQNGNFNWTEYKIEGQSTPVSQLVNYKFYRDTLGNGDWYEYQILSASSTAATDPNYANYPNGRWRVDAVWNTTCVPTARISTGFSKTRSNIKNKINCSINTTTTLIGNTITAQLTGAGVSYQWLDCSNGFASIIGQTGQSFLPSGGGSYAVKITLSGCPSDTSSCVVISSISLTQQLASFVQLAPNPANTKVSVSFGSLQNAIDALEIYDNFGRKVYHDLFLKANNADSYELDISGFANGIYVLRVQGSNFVVNKKLVVKH